MFGRYIDVEDITLPGNFRYQAEALINAATSKQSEGCTICSDIGGGLICD